jgi:hypothetical protein
VLSIRRISRVVAQAILIGLGLSILYFALMDWSLSDAQAYWEAAWRLRSGQELYPAVRDVEASTIFRYAPWFAFSAVPFTFLPTQVAGVVWSAILVAASVLAVAPMARIGAYVEAFFFGSVLIAISAIGNVQALVVAALVWGLERRSGPIWIAAAASLKAVPLVFAFVYLGRRQWARFALSLLLTAFLISHALVFDLSNYVTTAGDAGLLIHSPPIYAVVVGVGALLAVVLAEGKYGWLAAASTAVLAVPRFFVYDITFLVPGAIPATRTVTLRDRNLPPVDAVAHSSPDATVTRANT